MLLVDDGSADRTVELAGTLGVTHILTHARPRGAGTSFHRGAQRALELGADLVVTIDGDNRYPPGQLADLIRPVLTGVADIAVADRPGRDGAPRRRGPAARLLDRAAGTVLPDTTSGLRAYSRGALLRLNTVTRGSYRLRILLQAGNKDLAIASCPDGTRPGQPTCSPRPVGSSTDSHRRCRREHLLPALSAVRVGRRCHRCGRAGALRPLLCPSSRRSAGRARPIAARWSDLPAALLPQHHPRNRRRPAPHEPAPEGGPPRACDEACATRARTQPPVPRLRNWAQPTGSPS